MTGKWISCGDGFIEADVIRWREGVWERRSFRRNARAVNVGDRRVTAQVLQEDDEEWVHLVVRRCEMVSEKFGRKITLLAEDEEIRRRRRTITRREPERLLWSDETARGALVSKFLGRR
jgi:hypothetical protein